MIKLNCFSCSKELTFSSELSRREECPHCRADVHVCKNCQFYDSKVYNECRETQAEVIREKERANFCDYFTAGQSSLKSLNSNKTDLFAAAEALFKKKDS